MLTLLYIIIYLFVFFTGTCIGSFLNVLIYRIPRRISFIEGRSFCPDCHHQLAAKDLLPLLSWLYLRGRCRYCGQRISARYPLVEAAGGLLAVACAAVFGYSFQSLAAFAAVCILLTIALIDADTQEIPDGLIVALAVVGVAAVWLWPEVSLVERLIGVACVSVPMFLIDLLVPTSFGFGDIKMMAAAGLLLGWKQTLVAFFIAVLLGGGYGVFLLARRKKGRKEHFAFGPCLSCGVAAALLFGGGLLAWYLGFFA